MKSGRSSDQVEPIDPDIDRFVAAVIEGSARYPDLAKRSASERRAIAETIRAPWRSGGPDMARREELEVPFGDRNIRLRLLATEGEGLRPALIYLHGGGFVLLSLDTHDRLMREYAAGSGAVVIGVDYSLSPEARFPTALNEVIAVVDWLKQSADALGIDPDRIAIGGDSAGANLALSTCIALRDRGGRHPLSGMLLNYGFFDADFETDSQRRDGEPGGMLTRDELADFLDQYFQPGARRDDPLALPGLAQLHDLPPSFHVIAERDPLADCDRSVAERMAAAGNQVDLEVYAGATHSFLEAMSISAIARAAIADSTRWLRQTLPAQAVSAE
jgi:acetyl esterase